MQRCAIPAPTCASTALRSSGSVVARNATRFMLLALQAEHRFARCAETRPSAPSSERAELRPRFQPSRPQALRRSKIPLRELRIRHEFDHPRQLIDGLIEIAPLDESRGQVRAGRNETR